MAHVLRLRTDRLRSRGRQQSVRHRLHVRRRVYARQGRRTHQETDRHRLHVRPAQTARDSRDAPQQKEDRQLRDLHRTHARNRERTATVRQTEGITEICPIARQEANGREATVRQEETEVRADAASTITETAVRDVRRETDATSAAQVRDRVLTEEIPAGMI